MRKSAFVLNCWSSTMRRTVVKYVERAKLDEHSVPSEGGLINWLVFLYRI